MSLRLQDRKGPAVPEPLATMADVAARAGVSVATVSRALRGSELVSAATTARVRAAADELGFSVSRSASGLATGRLGRIAVLVGGALDTWFNGSILDAIYGRLRAGRPRAVDLPHPEPGRAGRSSSPPCRPAATPTRSSSPRSP